MNCTKIYNQNNQNIELKMTQSISIKNVFKNDKTMEIEWNDGKKSNFHFMWLRDNCPLDIHPTARERLFNLINVTENIHPKSYKIPSSDSLNSYELDHQTATLLFY